MIEYGIVAVMVLLGVCVFIAGVFQANERDRKRTKQYKITFKKF